ncbi:MAG TPA: CpaD family pilus assembly protein [Parvularculaceae bacterium]|nr:CpaD family pilus assembly protein [Parvularculaceae bacterium]
MKTTAIKLLVAASLAALGGCAGAWNGSKQALSIAEQHPISVDSQVVTLTLPLDADSPALTEMDKARLGAFADAYLTSGHGPLTITTPTGSDSDKPARERATYVRAFLDQQGVPTGALAAVSYRIAEGKSRDLILSYTHYVATPPSCGVWSGMTARDYANLTAPNFGCAAQHNLAAMVVDPHDLVEPAASSTADAMARVRMMDKYRAGLVTASSTDPLIGTNIAH